MIVIQRSQPPLPFAGPQLDPARIWDARLFEVDTILSDERFIEIALRSVKRSLKGSKTRGAARMAVNRTLRCFILKHLRNWPIAVLHRELQRNLDYRAFTQFYDDAIPDRTTLVRNLRMLDPQAIGEILELLREVATRAGVIGGMWMRIDTTVCEANIHHPTDSGLLRDGVRKLGRLMQRAGLPIRDRSRAALHRVLEIHRAARVTAGSGEHKRQRSYRRLLTITRAVLSESRHRMRTSEANTLPRALTDTVFRTRDLLERVIQQTRARVVHGNTHFGAKLFSLYDETVCAIRKGKAHKSTEFGRLIEVCEAERGFVSDFVVHEGNPDDTRMLIAAVERHLTHFGRAPRCLAADRGFWSAANEKRAHGLGVKRVSIPVRGRLSESRRQHQRQRWFRRLQRWRAGGEGRIGILKNCYGVDRCFYKGEDAMERWVGGAVIANNLAVLAHHRCRQRGKSSECGQTSRQAAAGESAAA
jgi:hypothetical protein